MGRKQLGLAIVRWQFGRCHLTSVHLSKSLPTSAVAWRFVSRARSLSRGKLTHPSAIASASNLTHLIGLSLVAHFQNKHCPNRAQIAHGLVFDVGVCFVTS